MMLETYKQKRNFLKSPEPVGGVPSGKKLHFVVQKHHASHLHYDFRLELKGILKSWAVPKGLSMNPAERRLAMLVEDHPWDYRNFEGIIPSGYGKGTVIVWDNGSYETTEIKHSDKKAQEHSVMSQFWKGQIKFTLHGHKLKGTFVISKVRSENEADKNKWYIVKIKDRYATRDDITKKDKSVLSKKTLEQVAKNPSAEWQSHKPEAKSKKQKNETQSSENDVSKLILKGQRSSFPSGIEPMLSTLVKEPFNDERYLYEVKLDGYRVIAYVKNKKAKLHSRSGLNYSKYYTSVVDQLNELDFDVVLDGEIVALNEKGQPDFDALQKNDGSFPLAFYAFDILWYEGYNLMELPLEERKKILSEVLPQNEIIRYSESFDDGLKLFKLMEQLEMEGMVAKMRDSKYQPGRRGRDWLKIQTEKRQEFVIGGWAESKSGTAFRTLLFGLYERGDLKFVGHAGHGFKEKDKPAIKAKLKKLEIKKCPFSNPKAIEVETEVHWVKPELVANIKFSTYTNSGKIRKPAVFLGFRDDKNPKDVIEEKAVETEIVKTKEPSKKIVTAEDSNWKELEKEKTTSKETFNIAGHDVTLTNIEKEIWRGITKSELIQYYHTVAPFILPHLKDRPLSLHVKNNGATKPGVYIKDMEGREPSFAEIFNVKRKHKKKGKRDEIDYLVCNNEATLLYIVNLGCIDVNPWTSRTSDYLHPDFIIIDLDPTDNDFKKVIETAIAAKRYFDKVKLKVFPKTSGKTGMHLYIPCEDFTFPEARSIAVSISKEISSLIPDIATSENTISKRGNKVFVDYNQNDEADTVAAPYSARPGPQPTVSTPLEWKEVNEKLRPVIFDITNIGTRIKKKGDLFEKVFDEAIRRSNCKVLKSLL